MIEETTIEIQAENPEIGFPDSFEISERAWRPLRSLIAIAIKRYEERHPDQMIILFNLTARFDYHNYYELRDELCRGLAGLLKEIISDPFTIVDYGMTIDIQNGISYYTYPSTMCTAYLEDVETQKFYRTLYSPGVLGKTVRSWFKVSEEELERFIDFLLHCGGIQILPKERKFD